MGRASTFALVRLDVSIHNCDSRSQVGDEVGSVSCTGSSRRVRYSGRASPSPTNQRRYRVSLLTNLVIDGAHRPVGRRVDKTQLFCIVYMDATAIVIAAVRIVALVELGLFGLLRSYRPDLLYQGLDLGGLSTHLFCQAKRSMYLPHLAHMPWHSPSPQTNSMSRIWNNDCAMCLAWRSAISSLPS